MSLKIILRPLFLYFVLSMLLTNNDFFLNKKLVSSKIQQANFGGGLEVWLRTVRSWHQLPLTPNFKKNLSKLCLVTAHSKREWRIKTASAVLLNKQSWEKKLCNSTAMSQLIEPHDPLEFYFSKRTRKTSLKMLEQLFRGNRHHQLFKWKRA